MTIKKSTVLMILTFIPLLFTEGMRNITGVSATQLVLLRGLDMGILILLLFVRKQEISLPAKILLIIYATTFVSALIHGTFSSLIYSDFGGFVMCVAFEFWLKNYFKKTIKFLYYALYVLVIANFILILLFPSGFYSSQFKFTGLSLYTVLIYQLNWLFGYKNDQFGYLMGFLAIACIYTYIKKGKISLCAKVGFLICILSQILAQATMASALTLIFVALMVCIVDQENINLNKYIMKFINLRTIVIVTTVVVIATVVLTSDNLIARILADFAVALGKDPGFNGRAAIWLTAINFIKESPIIGYGSIDSEIFIEQSGILGGTHAHNYILQIMIRGGLICLIEHIGLYAVTIKKIVKNKGYVAYTMGFVLGIFFIDGITSVNIYYMLFNPMFILAFYSIDYVKDYRIKPKMEE